jgi:hypothetical protein
MRSSAGARSPFGARLNNEVERIGAPSVASAVGNLVSGPLLRRGMPAWATIGLTFVAYAVSMVGIFCGGFSTPAVVLLAAFAPGVGGLAPGAIYSSAPKITPTTESLLITVGFFSKRTIRSVRRSAKPTTRMMQAPAKKLSLRRGALSFAELREVSRF